MDLADLIEELNSHSDLGVKLSSTSKISNILLQERELAQEQPVLTRPLPFDSKPGLLNEMRDAKQIRLGAFQSKIKLELKSMTIDPRVR